jgi:voltage-gated potassium channel
MSDVQVERWERATSTPLIVAGFAYLGAYALPILQPGLPAWAATACLMLNRAIYAMFLVDLMARLIMSEHRPAFLRRNWIDVLLLAVPMLRPLRALRGVLAVSIIARRGRSFARGRVVAYVAGAVALVAFIAALAMLDAERGQPAATVTTFGDALWWAATTVTTVGYGDYFPATTEGRLVAVGLMVAGIALLGVVTAALASWFVEKVGEVQAAERRTGSEVAELIAEVRALRADVAAIRDDRAEHTRPELP